MLAEWKKVAANSFKSVSATMGFDTCEVADGGKTVEDGLGGAFAPLVGQNATMQLGIMATPVGQEAVARVVLQMEPDEEIDHDCISDAMGELANCVVGQMKVAMRKVDPTLKIGLPVFIEGKVEDIGGAEQAVLKVQLNGVAVSLVVVAKGS